VDGLSVAGGPSTFVVETTGFNDSTWSIASNHHSEVLR
jgi:hypothetical protein